jgi:hypothetical protein
MEFKPEDFATEHGDLLAREAAEMANAKLKEQLMVPVKELLFNCMDVYSSGKNIWTTYKCPDKDLWHAKLILIEKIK